MNNNPFPAKYTMTLEEALNYITLFDFDYTFYNNTQEAKQEFQNEFIEHFKYREIGQETPELFKYYFRIKWKEKIGVYNKYKQAELSVDSSSAFNNIGVTTDNINIFNDAPKGIVDFDGKHARNYTKNINKINGLQGKSYADAARDFKNALYNADEEFFSEFNDLFMEVL